MNKRNPKACLPYCFLLSALLVAGCERITVPEPPASVGQVDPAPDWWSSVEIVYEPGLTPSNRWLRMREFESDIEAQVVAGITPVQKRRELVRYLTSMSSDPAFAGDHDGIKGMIIANYVSLGEYARAARQSLEILDRDPMRPITLYSLALNYERLGETNAANQVYGFMEKTFRNHKIWKEYADIATIQIRCLQGQRSDCELNKPDWQAFSNDLPPWWSDVTIPQPHLTSFADGVEFITKNIGKDGDGRKTVKAWVWLLEFRPITSNERKTALRSLANAYSNIGDHHRAIVSAWAVPQEFSCDSQDSILAIELIIAEFEALGDPIRAQEMKRILPCFASGPTPEKRR